MLLRPWTPLRALSLPEWRLHPWRHATVALAVALGVALAFSVHLINASALSEFAGAVRAANGEPDLTIASRTREGFDDTLITSLTRDPAVRVASPVVALDVAARAAPSSDALSLQVLGIDALQTAEIAPALLPRLDAASERLAVLDPDAVFANATALQRLNVRGGDVIELRGPSGWQRLRVAGTVAVGGAALLVVDIAAAQSRLGMAGRLSRIDLRLMPGVEAATWLRGRTWPDDVRVSAADELVAHDLSTAPHPGYPTDMQAQYMALATQARGAAVITETIFEHRFMHVGELQRMGADIRIQGHSCVVVGPSRLTAAQVMATDLRASACLVLAGLVAEGETVVDRVYHLDRGYESMESKLQALGAEVERIR